MSAHERAAEMTIRSWQQVLLNATTAQQPDMLSLLGIARPEPPIGAPSENGWPVIRREDAVARTVPGTRKELKLVSGPAGDILMWVAWQFNKSVEKLSEDPEVPPYTDDWSYDRRYIGDNPANPPSNHASGTAIDLNAAQHPLGQRDTFTRAQLAEIRAILDEAGNVIRWGGDYQTTPDEMHFEIHPDASPEKVAQVWHRIHQAHQEELQNDPRL